MEENPDSEDEGTKINLFPEGEYKYNGEVTDGSVQPSNTDLTAWQMDMRPSLHIR